VRAVLPALASPSLVWRRARARKMLALALLALVAIAVACLHVFYMPIDVAWYAILRRLAN